jgi:hypothetical protein
MTLSLETLTGDPWAGFTTAPFFYDAHAELMTCSPAPEAFTLSDPHFAMNVAPAICVAPTSLAAGPPLEQQGDCAPLPPPPGSPRLPASFSWQEPGPAPPSVVTEEKAGDWEGFRWPPTQEAWVVPIAAGVPAPKCAPPCSPAPAPLEAEPSSAAPLLPWHAP